MKMQFFWFNYWNQNLFFRGTVTIEPGHSLLQFVTTNCFTCTYSMYMLYVQFVDAFIAASTYSMYIFLTNKKFYANKYAESAHTLYLLLSVLIRSTRRSSFARWKEFYERICSPLPLPELHTSHNLIYTKKLCSFSRYLFLTKIQREGWFSKSKRQFHPSYWHPW